MKNTTHQKALYLLSALNIFNSHLTAIYSQYNDSLKRACQCCGVAKIAKGNGLKSEINDHVVLT